MVRLQLLTAALSIMSAAAAGDVDTHSWKAASKSGEALEIILGVNATTHLRYAVVKLDRKLCRPVDYLNISDSAETTDVLHSTTGPDEILLSVEGPSIQMFIFQLDDCNAYSTQFRIPVAGNYRVKVVALRGNYSAVNEKEDSYPVITYDTLLDTPMQLSKTASNPYSSTCEGNWIHKTPELSLQNETYHLEPPSFLRNLPISTYTSISNNPVTKVIDDKTYACAENSNNYDWMLSDCADSERQLLNSTDAAGHLAGKRILFIGDSHVRTFVNNMLIWSCGTTFPVVRSRSTVHTVPLTAALCPGLHVSYYVEYFCKEESLPKPGLFDLVVVNCGHHPAAGDGHYSLAQYRDAVTILADSAVLKGYKSNNFAWLESVPQPQRFDKFVVSYKDWRTYHRLAVFNKYANQILQKSSMDEKGDKGVIGHTGFKVIPAFDSLMPFSDKFCDNAHYSSPGSFVPQYQGLLQLLISHK